jgi:nucleoside-diphosphate-sugar epimerase
MDRILLTGATGVVGRRVLPLLVSAGHPVTAVGRTPQQQEVLRAVGATPVSMNVLDPASVRSAVAGHDAVINLATHMPSSMLRMFFRRSWRENDRIRRDGSAILASAAAAAGVRRFIQESFAPIHEDGGADWIDERWPVKTAAYNRTVLDAEASAERFGRGGGTGVALRFAWFYGPDPMLRQILGTLRKGWMPVPGAAGAYWPAVSHEDAATAAMAALRAPGGLYEVCDDEPLTRKEFGEVCARCVGAGPPRPLPRWLSAIGLFELMSRSLRLSNAKLRAATAWAPRWRSVREGVPEAARQLGLAIQREAARVEVQAPG